MECFHTISRTLYGAVQIPRKVVPAEPNIACYNIKTSVYGPNVFINCPAKSQGTWCNHIGDMKGSVILRDNLWISSTGIETPHSSIPRSCLHPRVPVV